MSDERIIPSDGQVSTVTHTLLLDGNELPPTLEVLSIHTENEANRIPTARVVLRDGDAAAEDFPLSNGNDFKPGGEIEIKAGYSSNESTIFKGIIVKHGIRVREHGSSALIVDCRDEAVKMTIGRRSRYFVDKTDTEVLEEIIGEYGLSADVAATDVTHPDLVQYHVSDWDYVLSRADANGMLAIVIDGAVAVQKPKMSGSADLSVLFGDTIYEFDAEIDARYQYDAVRAYAWDHSAQEVLQKDGTAPSPANGQGNLTPGDLSGTIGLDELALRHPGRLDGQELKVWADSHLIRSDLAKVVGRAKIHGFNGIKTGQLIDVNGVGERFSGTAFVGAVRHEIVRGAWFTDVQFGLRPDRFALHDDIVDVAAAGLVPAVHGLHIGVVTKLEGDPDSEERIQVRLPLVDPDAEGIWARWISPDAGGDRGIYFRPEIGDELIVGFLNEDPRDPVVLGSVHSSQFASPIPLSDDNHEKGIVTRSQMRLHFDDDKKVITVDTPGGNKAVISDDEEMIKLEDQHGNSVTLNSDGITLDGSNITLKAQQEIKLEAGTDLKAESGTNTEFAAGAQFKAEGSAGADFKTSAIATIEGSLVKIN